MKKIVTFCGLLLAAGTLQAKAVSEATAQATAYNKLKRIAPAAITGQSDMTLVETATGTVNGTMAIAYFVFNNAKGAGFVIISGDDNVEPILVYSATSNYNAENISPSEQYWLDGYKSQILDVVQNNLQGSPQVAAKWATLQSAPSNGLLKTTTVSVGPLLTTKWDQETYYDADCPYDNTPHIGQAARTITGCVATAMAQCMKYWNWPDTGRGTNTYTQSPNPDNIPAQTVNFVTAYNFDSMPAIGSLTHANAFVAKLMYHAGVSVNMDYGTVAEAGSGSYVVAATSPFTNCAEYAMKTYFRYKPTIQGIRRGHGVYTSDVKLVDTLTNELNNNRVVIYSGHDIHGQGGHCWMLDGYDNDSMFHFNWGWSGQSNNYYTIHKLAPSGTTDTFTNSQEILIHIVPDTPANMTFPVSINQVNVADNIKIYPNPASNVFNISLSGINASMIYITDIAGREVKSIPVNGQSLIAVSSADLSSGVYIVRIQTTDAGIITRKISIAK